MKRKWVGVLAFLALITGGVWWVSTPTLSHAPQPTVLGSRVYDHVFAATTYDLATWRYRILREQTKRLAQTQTIYYFDGTTEIGFDATIPLGELKMSYERRVAQIEQDTGP